jgi:hypothetical protein
LSITLVDINTYIAHPSQNALATNGTVDTGQLGLLPINRPKLRAEFLPEPGLYHSASESMLPGKCAIEIR